MEKGEKFIDIDRCQCHVSFKKSKEVTLDWCDTRISTI